MAIQIMRQDFGCPKILIYDAGKKGAEEDLKTRFFGNDETAKSKHSGLDVARKFAQEYKDSLDNPAVSVILKDEAGKEVEIFKGGN